MAEFWQIGFKNVEQRCGYLLSSGYLADCTFVLKEQTGVTVRMPAHKLLLASASPVFEKMFYGLLPEENEIRITDLLPGTFKSLLMYIYTGEIVIESFEMAWDLFNGANKYMLPHLLQVCRDRISKTIEPTNVLLAYELAQFYEEETLKTKCLQKIISNTNDILDDIHFLDAQFDTLITVLSIDNLNVASELDLFHAVARYAEATSEERDTVLLQNFNEAGPRIKEALKKIRFLSLTAQEFAEGPALSNLLSNDEASAIFMNIEMPGAVPMPPGFSECQKRRRDWDPFLDGGKVDEYINLLKSGETRDVERGAHCAVEILNTPNRIQTGLKKGLLDALIPALCNGTSNSQFNAACAIMSLCERGTPSQLHVLATSAALEPFCQLLRGDDSFWVLVGLTALLKRADRYQKNILLKLQEINIERRLKYCLFGDYGELTRGLLDMIRGTQ